MDPLWLSKAREELGTHEVAGDGDNPKIIKYWVDAGLGSVSGGNDEVPWCAAFVNAMLARSNIPGSRAANARSFEGWGRKLITPCLGAVIVFSRPPNPWQGHVAFYLGSDRSRRVVRVLGGNQSDAVSIADISIDRIVSIRWPTSSIIQPEWVGPIDVSGPAKLSTNES